MKKILWAVAVAALLAPGVASAGGFNIYEMGSRATALGGAFTATADDASAVFYNPAGMGFLPEGWQISLNVSPIRPSNGFARAEGPTAIAYPGDATSTTQGTWFFPTGAYATWRKGPWSAGLGFFTPFGLGVEWDDQDTFSGRPLSVNAQIQGFYLSPVVAYRPHPRVAVSVGVHVVKTHLTLERILTANAGTGPDPINIADVKIEGTSQWTAGLAAALMYKPVDKLTLGANYKMGVTNDFQDQDASFTQRSTGSAALDAAVEANLIAQVGRLGTQSVSGELDYPDIVSLGARYDFSPRFGVEFDAVWFGWSTFDEVVLDFELAPTTTLEEFYRDEWQYRLGLEYSASDRLRLLAGYVRDISPQPKGSISPLLPDANRNDFSLGATWTSPSGAYDLTAGYMLVEFEERDTLENGVGQNFEGFDGSYKSRAHILTLAYSRRF